MQCFMDYFDTLETRSDDERRAQQLQALSQQLKHISSLQYYRDRLTHLDLELHSLGDLSRFPVTRKSDLAEQQAAMPPFAGIASTADAQAARVFSSPGGIYELQAHGDDYWRIGRALYAAGFRRGDLVHNTFSYHLTPAGAMLESGAFAVGCSVFPAGVGQTELQLQAMAHLKPQGYVGTPSFLKRLLLQSVELGTDISSITKALVSGEALPPSLRQEIKQQGIDIYQCYASADLGLIAYESAALEGMIVDEGVILELLVPGTDQAITEGEVGEVVVTTFNQAYPLLRFATGDLSAFMPGVSPCGRSNSRIQGWMGRADQTTKVRGMFVHPSQVAAVLKRHPELIKARLVVTQRDHQDHLILRCEQRGASEDLHDAVVASMRELTKLRSEVELIAEGDLPKDGKIIDDQRDYK